MLSIRDLRVRYGAEHVVHGVSLEVGEGESVALVGESGSGKSTVLKAVMGLVADWSGEIRVAGAPRRPRLDRGFARQCQMVFQDPYASLHPRRTVNATLGEPLAIHGLGDRDARIAQALHAVGLDRRFRFRFPHQLSGGQRQRVAIARALMGEPRLLLLDEPTSALDVSVQAEVLNLLRRLRRERGLTYLFVTHNLPVVSFMCERLAIMEKGRVVEEADVEGLREGRLVEAYSRQLLEATPPEIDVV